MLYSCLCYIAYMLYSRLCYIAYMLYSTRQGVICIRCYIASYMATTKVPDGTANLNTEALPVQPLPPARHHIIIVTGPGCHRVKLATP